MSLPNYLSNIKSSGIYRFVWDKSEIPGAQAETLRLVVGYSEKGPFNTPVYVKDDEEFKTIYGGINKKLERYGIWFHRMAIQALKRGPILALNLKPFDDEKVEGVSFNPQECVLRVDENLEIQGALELAVKNLYNTNRFWTLEPEHLEDIESVNDKYINIFTTDSRETSSTIFIRGYQPSGYDVTVKEWYSSVLNGEDVPSYLEGHENDYISQYWAEIFIFKGEFTAAIATSDKLAKFFNVESGKVTLKPYLLNAFGEKLDTLSELAKSDASNFVKSYAGILLPEFLSSTNTVLSLDAQFNSDHSVHKMMMRLNQALLYNDEIAVDQLDTTGWTKSFVDNADKTPFMSFLGLDPQVSVASFVDGTWQFSEPDGATVDFFDYDIEPGDGVDDYSISVPAEMSSTGMRTGDKILMRQGDAKQDVITSIVKIDDITVPAIAVDVVKDMTPAGEIEVSVVEGDVHTSKLTYKFASNVESGDLDTIFANIHEISEAQTITIRSNGSGEEFTWDDDFAAYMSIDLESATAFVMKAFGDIDIEGSGDLKWNFTFEVGSTDIINVEFVYTSEVEAGKVTLGAGTEQTESVGYIYTFDKQLRGINDEGERIPDADFTLGGKGHFVKCVNSVTATSANMFPTYLRGYTYSNPKPASTKQWDKLQWQHKILDVLTQYKGIRIALTDRVSVDYRYLVDTFEGFVEAECKSRLARICKEKDNVLGLLNFPPMANFSKCDYVSFTDANSLFDTKFIPMGGNPQKARGCVFTLASEENGASWVSYNTCLNMRDLNTGIKFTCPPAALVSNLYMDKYTKFFPYTIIAGPNRAVIRENGLIGPDFNFGRYDLDNLESFGVNAMVQVPGQGTYINSNQTAKQNPVTTLSKINVRELCIFLQDEIEKLLQKYQWDFNTPNLQSTIKDRADVILETAKNNGGVYKYLNVCDDSNNTDDVINNEFFILSTSIEPGMGAGKMVQNLTLYRKGGMSSTIITY